MTLSNNYIFLRKPQTEEPTKVDNKSKNVIVVNVKPSISWLIAKTFPEALKVSDGDNGSFVHKYIYPMQLGGNNCKIEFVISEVVNSTYLVVTAEGKNKSQIIHFLESVHESITCSNDFDDYICIISYDSISEYYCNKMYPKLNELERNLRRLLFNVYIVNFGLEYYETTISDEYQEKAKKLIETKGGKQKRRETYIQQFFYGFTYDEIHKVLFTPHWTKIEENSKRQFLDKHEDLSRLTDAALREAFLSFEPKSDWERFFSSKVSIDDIENTLDIIRRHRNNIAHCKFFYKNQYAECIKLTRKLNNAILNAIRITEESDFVVKNSESIAKTLKVFVETMKEFYSKMMPQITATTKSLAAAMVNLSIMPSVTLNFANIFKAYCNRGCEVEQAEDGSSDSKNEIDRKDTEDVEQQ